MATVFVAVAFFAHIFLPATEPEVRTARAKINSVEEEIAENNLSLLKISRDLHEKSISVSEFNKSYESVRTQILLLNDKLPQLKDEYKKIKEEAKIFGYPSRHKFIWNFGIGLLLFELALELMLTSMDYEGEIKQAKKFGALTVGTTAGYYMAWVFFPDNDFELPVYFTLIFVIGLLSSFTAYWLISISTMPKKKLKQVIRYLNGKIISDIPPMIKDVHVNEYEELIWEALDHETK